MRQDSGGREIAFETRRLYPPAMFRKVTTYYRLTKPERTLTNVLTAAAGYLFASKWHVAIQPLVALLVGSSLIIASACVLNNLMDRDMDRKMKRTKKRALVTGKVSVLSAFAFAGVLGAVGFWTLTATNWLTFIVGAISFIGYVLLYDFAKRVSAHGTLVGTIPGGASLVAGYTAFAGRFDATALLLFIIMAAWQMAHFYAIAIYRVDDYKAAGVPVWSVRHGVKSTKLQIMGYVAIFTLACALLTLLGHAGYIFLILTASVGVYWFWRGVHGFQTEIDDVKWARSMFSLSLVVVMVLSVMLAVGSILP